jgi:amino acid adenylation domain-containing protein
MIKAEVNESAGINEIAEESAQEVFVFPASLSQQRFWVLDQIEHGNPAYNVPVRFILHGPLDVGLVEKAFNEIVRRHEILRTTFALEDGQPVQIIAAEMRIQVPVTDIRSIPDSQRIAEADRLGSEEAKKRFDLTVGPLIRADLIQTGDQEHILQVTIHHAVSDGWSIGIVTDELGAIYEALLKGEESPLPPLPIQYADFAVWQKDWLQSEAVTRQMDYWRKKLENSPPFELLTDRPRPAVKSFSGEIISILLSKELTDKLQEYSNRQGATLFMTYLAAFKVLLHRYSGQDDIVLGSPIVGRNRVELEPMIGVFINTLVFRTDLSGDISFTEVLSRVKDTVLQGVAHQDIPFEQLVQALRPTRDPSRNPFFQINFTHQRDFVKPITFGGVSLTAIPSRSPGAIFDLHFFMVERDGIWRASADFNSDLFETESMRRMLNHFKNILEAIVADPGQSISRLPLLSSEERNRILLEWNNNSTDYPREKCIHEVFEEQVVRAPNAVALIFEDQQLTYRQLNQRANHLAHQLREHDVGPNTLVAICAERSIELIVGILAILKAGGAYVPLDPGYPKERLQFMLQDIKATVLMAQQRLASSLPTKGTTIIYLDTPHAQASTTLTASENPRCEANAESLAYVMYTSGSTGRPKGTTIPHRGVTRLVKNTNYAQFGPDETFLQFAPVSFDASTLEIWGPLLNGGRLVIMPPGAPSLESLGKAIRRHNVSTLWLTAGLFRVMVDERIDDLKPLKQLLAGGDVLPVSHVTKVLQELPGCRLINGYGPTENTTFTCCHTVTKEDLKGNSIPIGKPVANTQVYILDRYMQPVPIGVPGELHTGGDGLAQGYLNQPELTAQKFLPNPFTKDSKAKLYKTGDLCRYLADGRIEFLGRIDQQVKIRGFRIELEEIEAVLGQNPSVKESVVIVREDNPGEKVLVGYVVPKSDAKWDAEEVRSYLKSRLPDYMVPSAFVSMDVLPLTPNGKVDKRALPKPQLIQSGDGKKYVAPSTPIEEVLAGIWRELLKLEKVGIHDNFFELGGNSLLSIQIIDRLNRAGLNFSPSQFFHHQTIAELASVVVTSRAVDSKGEEWSSLVTLQPNGTKPPFYLLHTSPGDVLGYMKLVYYLGSDQPCYGFQSLGLQNPDQSHTSLEEMAAHYVKLMRKFQPEGPYYLGGWCFGGNVAWEMAHQLRAQGQKVAFLGLLETWAHPPRITHPRYYVHRLLALCGLGPRAILKVLQRRVLGILKLRKPVNPEVEEFAFNATVNGPLKNREHVYKINLAATRKYKSKPYPGIITLFNGTYYQSQDIIPPQSGFMTLADDVEIHLIPGSHRSVIKEPNVQLLADKLKTCLQAAQMAEEKAKRKG